MRGGEIQYSGCIVEETQQRVQICSDLTFDWKPPKKLSGSIYWDFNLPRISNVVLHFFIQLFSVWLKTNNQLAEFSQNDRSVVRMETSVEARALSCVICLILGSRTGRRPTGSRQTFTKIYPCETALGVTTAQQNGLILFEMCSDNGDWASLVPINNVNEQSAVTGEELCSLIISSRFQSLSGKQQLKSECLSLQRPVQHQLSGIILPKAFFGVLR